MAYQLASHFVATSDKGTGRKLDGLLLEHGLFYRSGPKKLQPVLLHATDAVLFYKCHPGHPSVEKTTRHLMTCLFPALKRAHTYVIAGYANLREQGV